MLRYQKLTMDGTIVTPIAIPDGAAKTIVFQFQCVTWKLEKLLGNLPYDKLDISSEEVREQVDLVRTQLRRTIEKYGYMISKMPSYELSHPLAQEISQVLGKHVNGLHKQNNCPENLSELNSILENNGGRSCSIHRAGSLLEKARSIPASSEVSLSNVTNPERQKNSEIKSLPEVKKNRANCDP